MKHVIKLTNWNYSCGDSCCDDYGTRLEVNGEIIDDNFRYRGDFLVHLLKSLGISEYELIVEDEDDAE